MPRILLPLHVVGMALLVLVCVPTVRGAETTNPSTTLPPAQFELTSGPPRATNAPGHAVPPSVSQSNAARLMQRRAELLNQLRTNQVHTNGSVSAPHPRQATTIPDRIKQLKQKQADGTLTPREEQQLKQLELLESRHQPATTIPDRIKQLKQKQADGTLTPPEEQQLKQLELLESRHQPARTNQSN